MSAPAPPGPGILRDAARLVAADPANLLPAAGFAGAQVRRVAEQLTALPSFERPRSLVVVGRGAMIDAAVLAALSGSSGPAPTVFAPVLPPWVGPLDAVLVLAEAPDDQPAALASAQALRRGAVTVVRGSANGPVADAAGRALMPATIAVPESMAAAARWSLLVGFAALAGIGSRPDLAGTADLLDSIAMRLHPRADSFRNTAVNLAEYLSDGVPLLIGTDEVGDAVARHAAAVFMSLAGVPAAAMASTAAARSPALLGRLVNKDIFADLVSDGEAAALARPVLLSAVADTGSGSRPGNDSGAGPGGRRLLSGLQRMLPGAMSLDVVQATDLDAEAGQSARGHWSSRPADPPDSLAGALALALQIEFAAIYLGICAGQVVPPDFPDGLGHTGGTRWAVRPDTVAEGSARQRDAWD